MEESLGFELALDVRGRVYADRLDFCDTHYHRILVYTTNEMSINLVVKLRAEGKEKQRERERELWHHLHHRINNVNLLNY